MLKTTEIYPYIYWDESNPHAHPDFDYAYRILATKFEGFLEVAQTLREKKLSFVLAHKERADFIRRNFKRKEPESNGYKSFAVKKMIKKPHVNLFIPKNK